GMFLERVRPGAFMRAIRERQDTQLRLNHDANLIVSRISNQTLRLQEDSKGLRFEATVAKTSVGDDLIELVKTQTLRGCSFSFVARQESWSKVRDASGRQRDLRDLLDVDLYDVSVVSDPQYSGTSVANKPSEGESFDGNDDGDSLSRMLPFGLAAG